MLDSAVSSSGPSERYLSISSLNPYVHRWQVKARVVDKSPLQTTKNNSRFFHVDITDCAVYCFSRGRVNVANKRFSTLSNNYELSFSADSDIKPAEDDGSIHAKRSLCTMPLRSIFNSTRECPFPTDVLAVVVEVQPISSVIARSSGEELKRRVLKVRDKSQVEMEVSLWGEQVDSITESAPLPQVYGLTGLNIRDWRGARSASTTKSSQIIKAGAGLLSSEEEASAAEMLQWYTTTGSSLSFHNMSRGGPPSEGASNERKPVQEMSIKDIKEKNEPGTYAFIAQVRRIYWKPRQQQQQSEQPQQDIYAYAACPTCRKKLHEDAANEYSCYPCNTSHVTPDWRYMLLASFIDATGSLSCRCFADMGQSLLGSPASEVRGWSTEKKEIFFDWQSILKNSFRVLVKAEFDNYNGEQRMRYTALRVDVMDSHSLALLLYQQIKTAVPTITDFAESKKSKFQESDSGLQREPKRSVIEAH
ncbi:replication factor-A C terminal domain-containing protein, putative [Eimeria tenella]|uniref:Replication factor-A C terminal domain-containing protein, putative n=1 Tax=Eimeria tenella TaxID=5802 RepID=U6KZA3_EIMTE|nr:replication factor-A C terminal domain-containing protein, putative [Eimeria tenella]CDJ42263.1 replication factor-A C terminal domain-containing protein, putative [Eimeria tenella]|eukprot:XP_013233013.1 replication factor-A C terminal domain-containing protein, putative [Eimeria tenella]